MQSFTFFSRSFRFDEFVFGYMYYIRNLMEHCVFLDSITLFGFAADRCLFTIWRRFSIQLKISATLQQFLHQLPAWFRLAWMDSEKLVCFIEKDKELVLQCSVSNPSCYLPTHQNLYWSTILSKTSLVEEASLWVFDVMKRGESKIRIEYRNWLVFFCFSSHDMYVT